MDARHPHEIEIDFWRFGCETVTSDAGGSGGGTGRPRFTDATFSCRSGSASPRLLEACATGRVIPEAVLTRDSDEGGAGSSTVARFTDVRVSGYTTSGGSRTTQMEEFRLQFARVSFSVRIQQPDGRLGDPVTTTQPGPAERGPEPPQPTPGSGGVWRPRTPLPKP